jgi:uncharacterized protein YlxW (UPF0749 family)
MKPLANPPIRVALLMFLVVSFFIGLFLPGQARIIQEMKMTYQNQNPADLVRVIKDLQQRKDELLTVESDLSQKLSAYAEAADDVDAQILQLKKETVSLEEQVGGGTLVGPGVRVVIREESSGASPSILADEDLLLLVNDLWASGAEVMTINGIRLRDMTALYRAGLTVRIGSAATHMPLTIEAIGDAEDMAKGLSFPGGALDLLNLRRIGAIVQKVDLLRISD